MSEAETQPAERAEARPDRRVGARRMEDEALPAWYRTAAAASWRFLAIAAAIAVVVYALVHLRVVVLPIIVALPASTLLLALVRWLKDRNAPDALAAAVAMIAAALLVVAVATAVAPSVADQFDELRPQAEEGIREASDVLADPPFNVSDRELDQTVDEGIAQAAFSAASWGSSSLSLSPASSPSCSSTRATARHPTRRSWTRAPRPAERIRSRPVAAAGLGARVRAGVRGGVPRRDDLGLRHRRPGAVVASRRPAAAALQLLPALPRRSPAVHRGRAAAPRLAAPRGRDRARARADRRRHRPPALPARRGGAHGPLHAGRRAERRAAASLPPPTRSASSRRMEAAVSSRWGC
jgi:hypothetical protein